MVMKILKSLIAGCDLGKKGDVCLANQAILDLASFCAFYFGKSQLKCDTLDLPPPSYSF